MELNPDFAYQPNPPVPTPPPVPAAPQPPSPMPPQPNPPAPLPGPPMPPMPPTPPTPLAPPTPPAPPMPPTPPLGPLAGLLGRWEGSGFNTIWQPARDGTDHFLQLNLTKETWEFDAIPGTIPNRGLLQADLEMAGLRYLQQVTDANLGNGLHIEPGVWLNVPATSDPAVPPSIARLGNVPHGTSFVAQGIATPGSGKPSIQPVSISPFNIGAPANPDTFAEQQLANDSPFRTSGPGLNGITQPMLNDANSVLTNVLSGLEVASFVELMVSSNATAPILGGGTANTAFLGGGADGPNADAAQIDATFWLLTLEGQSSPTWLLYTQTVRLNFAGISWPHVSVAAMTVISSDGGATS